MNEWNVRCLTTVPVSDGNFKFTLVAATSTEIRQAICLMENASSGKHKSRLAACKQELRVREMKAGS